MAHILKNLKKNEYDLIFSRIGKYLTFIWIYLLLITFFAVTYVIITVYLLTVENVVSYIWKSTK